MKRVLTCATIGITYLFVSPSFIGHCADSQPGAPNAQPPASCKRAAYTGQQIVDSIPGVKFRKDFPTNFPVPKYTSNVTSTNFMYSTKGIPTATASIGTSDPADKVFDWYKQACLSAGWQIKTPESDALKATAKRDKLYMIEGTRPKEEMSLAFITTKKKAGTTISIRWSKTL